MEPLVLSRSWHLFSLFCGVLAPTLVWGWIGKAEAKQILQEPFLFCCLAIVVLEMGGLVLWMLTEHRSRTSELAFAALFAFGALFAAAWSCFGLIGLIAMLQAIEHATEPGWWSCVMIAASPLACIVVYGGNARLAFARARDLKRQTASA